MCHPILFLTMAAQSEALRLEIQPRRRPKISNREPERRTSALPPPLFRGTQEIEFRLAAGPRVNDGGKVARKVIRVALII